MKGTTKTRKQAGEDWTLNRVLIWFGAAVVLEFLLLLLNRYYVNFSAGGTELAYGLARFLRTAVWVFLALAAAALVWLIIRRSRKEKYGLPAVLCAICFALCVCAAVAVVWRGLGIQMLYVAVPVVAVLALVYYLYQRELFYIALMGGVCLFALWTYRKLIRLRPGTVYGVFTAAAAATVIMVILVLRAQRGKGLLTKGGEGKKPLRFLAAKANYWMLYTACAVNAVVLPLALILGGTVAYVLLFLVMAWLFGAVVYYTVRLL